MYATRHRNIPTTSRHINRWLDGVTADEKPQEFFDNLTISEKRSA